MLVALLVAMILIKGDLGTCLWASVAFVLTAGAISLLLSANRAPRTRPIALKDLGE